jgi:CubicO group peptidase (beta-lactamase class C family)
MSTRKSINIRKHVITFALLFTLLFTFSCTGEPQKPENIQGDGYAYTKEWITWYVTNELMKKVNVPSVTVALIDDQEIVWQEAFGYANLEEKNPATVDTVYRMGSVSKPFTGLAIMKLYEDGVIDIDAPITDYLPDFSMQSRFSDSDPITIRSIMAHRAGLPRESSRSGTEMGLSSSERISLQEIIDEQKDTYIAYPDGYRYKYSNFGVTILGRIIEVVTKTEFAEYMQKTILNPLGMNNSSYLSSPELKEKLAMGYVTDNNITIPQPQFDCSDLPAANLYSTLDDMTKFLKFLFRDGEVGGNQLIEKETLEMMYVDYYSGPRDPVATGLTFFPNNLASGHFVVGHDGSVPGFVVYTVFLPDEKLGFVFLTNSIDTPLFPPYFKILELMLETKQGIKPVEIEMPNPVTVDRTILEKYTGKYSLAILMDVSLKGNSLQIKIPATGTFNVIPVSETKFRFPPIFELIAGYTTMEFFVGDEDEEDILIWEYLDTDWYDVCPKVTEPDDTANPWYERTGEYTLVTAFSDETIGTLTISTFDNILIGEATIDVMLMTAPLVFTSISDTELLVVGFPYDGETLLYDNETGYFTVSGMIAKPVEQDKTTIQTQARSIHEIPKKLNYFRR